MPPDYFERERFAPGGALFRRLTCVGCGGRYRSLEAFRAHRREGCAGRVPGHAVDLLFEMLQREARREARG